MHTFNLSSLIINEVALDGLDGTEINLVFKRLQQRTGYQMEEKMKHRLWKYILNLVYSKNLIIYYVLPAIRPNSETIQQFVVMAEENDKTSKAANLYLYRPHEFYPCATEYGSCKYYTTRTIIPTSEIANFSLDEICYLYDNNVVLVASQEDRWKALAGHLPIDTLQQLTNHQYCLLELIGKARDNGPRSQNKANIFKITEDNEIFSQDRKILEQLNLIKTRCVRHVTDNVIIKITLLQLARFYNPGAFSLPKVGNPEERYDMIAITREQYKHFCTESAELCIQYINQN